jgi:hypothetical protein
LVHLVGCVQPKKQITGQTKKQFAYDGGLRNRLLNGFLNFSAAETACADPNAFWLTINQCTDWLKVGFEDALGLVISVTDVMAGLATFATEITCICHGYTPLSGRMAMHDHEVENLAQGHSL